MIKIATFSKLFIILLLNLPYIQLFPQQIGPEKGSLVIVGGNARIAPEVFKKFIDLAGGPTANIVIIPTANGGRDFGPAYQGSVYPNFQQHGAMNLQILHTDDREIANSALFVKVIEEATGIWFMGGRQWRLADAYLDTQTEIALRDLLDRGGVIGGSSAGATIQGSYLVRGDTKTNTIMMGDHEEGFAFLKNSAIDQHLLQRNRQFDLVEVMKAKPDLLGIGLDEGTAIVVKGNTFEVIGVSFVAIYDPKIMTDKTPFYLLRAGDLYDLVKRKAYRKGSKFNEVELPRN
ncbi:MAG: cyanophycinase [Bacteroidota bacterium]